MELWTNNATSILDADIADSDLSLSVAAGEGALFPSPSGGNFFYATLEQGATREIVKVTARATDAFTIVRAQQGTAAAAFTAGATVDLRWTRYSAEALRDSIARVDKMGLIVPPLTADAMDDEMDGGALDPKWSWHNQGTSVITFDDDCYSIEIPTSSGDNLRMITQPLPSSGNTTYKVGVEAWMLAIDVSAQIVGLALRESSTNKVQVIFVGRRGGAPTYRIGVAHYTNDTTFGADDGSFDLGSFGTLLRPFQFRVGRSGSTLTWQFSSGRGGYWKTVYSGAESGAFTTRADQVALLVATNNGSAVFPVGTFKGFRRLV